MSNSAASAILRMAALLIQMFHSTSSLLSLYASFSTSLMLFRNLYQQLVPTKLEEFIKSKFKAYFASQKTPTCLDTFIIDDFWEGLPGNKRLEISRFYLSTLIGPENKIIRVGKFRGQKTVTASLVQGEEVIDYFQGIQITWRFNVRSSQEDVSPYFEVVFNEKYRDKVFDQYLKHVISVYKDLTKGEDRVLRLYSLSRGDWSIDFHHSASFYTIAMDPESKKMIVEDLDRFLTRKDYYKRIGKAWKRGYLLYGPPGTRKSSLIAAMANYLKYDIYNLELSDIGSDYALTNAILNVDRKSIIVVEDIDCNAKVHDRSKSDDSDSVDHPGSGPNNTSSSSLEERIIVFTTNHKEVLDPALLHPGRMDMHIHLSYCTPQGFRVLASNYLEIKEHPLLKEIDELIEKVEATPASLAEEMMKNDDPDVALAEVVKFLEQKKIEKDEAQEQEILSLT